MKIAALSWQRYHGRKAGSIGSSVIRVDWLCQADTDFVPWSHGISYDAIIMQKVYWRDLLVDFHGASILDLCDPDWYDSSVDIAELSKLCGAITVNTQVLADSLRGYVQCPIFVVPDRINFSQLPAPRAVSGERAKIVAWYGYIQNAREVLGMVLDDLARLHLKLLVVSNMSYEPLDTHGVEIINVPWEHGSAWREIQRADIVLNPRWFTPRFTYKSNNKTIIAQALGLPVAYDIEELEALMEPDGRKKQLRDIDAKLHWDYDIKRSAEQYKQIIAGINAKKGT